MAGPILVNSFYYDLYDFYGTDNILANQVMYVKKKEHILVRFIIACGVLNLILNAVFVYFDLFSGEVAVATTGVSTFVLVCLEYFYIENKNFSLDLLSRSNLKYSSALFFKLLFQFAFLVRTFLKVLL